MNSSPDEKMQPSIDFNLASGKEILKNLRLQCELDKQLKVMYDNSSDLERKGEYLLATFFLRREMRVNLGLFIKGVKQSDFLLQDFGTTIQELRSFNK